MTERTNAALRAVLSTLSVTEFVQPDDDEGHIRDDAERRRREELERVVGDDDEGAGAQRVGQLGGQRGEEEEEGADGLVLRLEPRGGSSSASA